MTRTALDLLELDGSDPGAEHFEARVKVLSEYVHHHVGEEDFAKARKSDCDLEARGEQLQARKAELGGEAAPAEVAALAGRGTARARNGQRPPR